MSKVISAFAWNKTEDVGVPPQRHLVIGKRRNGEDLVSIVDDECLVIFEGKNQAFSVSYSRETMGRT